jgi:hypothetical protein
VRTLHASLSRWTFIMPLMRSRAPLFLPQFLAVPSSSSPSWVYRQHTPLLVRGMPADPNPSCLSAACVKETPAACSSSPSAFRTFPRRLAMHTLTCTFLRTLLMYTSESLCCPCLRTLTRQARDIGLTARPNKCCASGPDAASAAHVPRMLCIPQADAGFVAGRVPLGSHTFISDHLSSRARSVT